MQVSRRHSSCQCPQAAHEPDEEIPVAPAVMPRRSASTWPGLFTKLSRGCKFRTVELCSIRCSLGRGVERSTVDEALKLLDYRLSGSAIFLDLSGLSCHSLLVRIWQELSMSDVSWAKPGLTAKAFLIIIIEAIAAPFQALLFTDAMKSLRAGSGHFLSLVFPRRRHHH